MAGVRQPKIIATHVWGARPAKAGLKVTGKPKRIIFHHTFAHHAEIENPQNESRERQSVLRGASRRSTWARRETSSTAVTTFSSA
jgi:hypothetical protein